MSKPVIQVTNRTPYSANTQNVTLEGNREKPTKSYVDLWEEILVPKGGLEGILLEGMFQMASIALSMSLGGWFAIAAYAICICYLLGGGLAVILEPSLGSAWLLRALGIALGFVFSLL